VFAKTPARVIVAEGNMADLDAVHCGDIPVVCAATSRQDGQAWCGLIKAEK
jgi:hypothetical protein